MLFSHIWGNSWITSFAVEPLAQLEILACCLRGLECCWHRKWCLPREMRLAKWNPLWLFLKLQWNFSEEICKTSCCSRCSLSLWRSQRQGSGSYHVCIHLLMFAYMALTWMAWLKCLLWLSAVLFVEASTAICGLKFVTLGTVKFLSGSLSTAIVSSFGDADRDSQILVALSSRNLICTGNRHYSVSFHSWEYTEASS